MKFDHYMKFVVWGVNLKDDTYRERLMLAGMGLGGEAGKVCDHAKKVAFHGKDMYRHGLALELGAILWYFTLMLSNEGITLEQVMEANVYELCDRYPHLHGDPEDIIAGKAT